MTRFNTHEEVLVYANKAAAEDAARSAQYGIDLNPFCTDGARNMWQRGYDGLPPRGYELPCGYGFNTIYQRGAAARRLTEAKA